jgi:DNA-directed RNA polymerase beta' subunit
MSQPKYTLQAQDNVFMAAYKIKGEVKKVKIDTEEIYKIFVNISDDDVRLLGFNPERTRPINFIIKVLPVLPPRSRPFIVTENIISDDDLTISYSEIIKANNNLKNDKITETKRMKYIESLIFRVKTLMDNSQGKAKHTNSRPMKGFKERLSGKDGLIRNNLMGKRCLAPETPILMWDGSIKRADEIQMGDILIGDKGNPRVVNLLHNDYDNMFKVIQSNGDAYTTNSLHILSLKFPEHLKVYYCSSRNKYKLHWLDKKTINSKQFNTLEEIEEFKKGIQKSDIIDIPIDEYLSLSKSVKSRLRGFKLNTPVKWESKDVDIDPYILGMWLGDGNQREDGLTNKLMKYNLINNKHIPKDYLINDKDIRLKLLAGLIDTKGSVENNGTNVRISQCFDHKQIQFLARSLGFTCSIRGNDLVISGKIGCIPTLLPCVDSKYDTTIYKIRVKQVEYGKFYGFSVSDNKRFLLGDFTVTHNTNFSARTVIGPDPTLRLNEIAVPHEICNVESYPENVNQYNIEKLQKMVWNGDVNMIDKVHLNNQSLTKSLRIYTKFALKNEELREKCCKLEIGDIVHRKLQNGDIVLLNRQPTLHKGSMLAKKIVRRSGKTIRMNLATTSTFNADFDGDEMNLFIPQSETSRTELELLSKTEHNMIGVQSSNPVITIVQDALLSCYLMTRNNEEIDKSDFFQLTMNCDTELETPGGIHIETIQHKIKMAEQVFKKFGKDLPVLCGKTLFSLLLPDDLNYTSHNKADENEPVLKIYKGIIYEGCVNKKNLKGGHNSFICLFNKEYGKETALHFVNNVQFLATDYLLYHGYSVGIGDCVSDVRKTGQIDEIITKCFVEAQGYIETIKNERIKEAKINMCLSKAKDIGMRIAKESLSTDNNFIGTVTSGSKGDYFNIAQIMGLLGQQNISGGRIKEHLNNRSRTLPHYPMNNDCLSQLEKYTSKGFITNSFLKGLSPQEFWFHAMSGREGVTDTAMKTAQSGYTQRKMVKIMEDVQIKYDQSVRNSMGSIIQFSYGGDNLCGTKTILHDEKPFHCNIDRIMDRLNNQYELDNDII